MSFTDGAADLKRVDRPGRDLSAATEGFLFVLSHICSCWFPSFWVNIQTNTNTSTSLFKKKLLQQEM